MKCELTVVWTVEEVDIEPNKCDFDEMWIKCSLNRWGRYWTWRMWRIWDLNEPNVQPHERLSQYSNKIFNQDFQTCVTQTFDNKLASLEAKLVRNSAQQLTHKCRAIYVAKNIRPKICKFNVSWSVNIACLTNVSPFPHPSKQQPTFPTITQHQDAPPKSHNNTLPPPRVLSSPLPPSSSSKEQKVVCRDRLGKTSHFGLCSVHPPSHHHLH